MALAEPHLGEHVLEVGAGHGSMTERLAARGRVTATEVSERCVPLLEERYRHYDQRHESSPHALKYTTTRSGVPAGGFAPRRGWCPSA